MNHGWEKKRLGEICKIKTGKLDANAKVENGLYPFFTCDASPYRINEYAFDDDAILISGNGSNVGHVHYYNGKFNAYQRTYVLTDFSLFVTSYLVAYMKGFLRPYIFGCKKGGCIPFITLPILSNFLIPCPSVEKQNQIVGELDKLNELIDLKRNQLKDLDALAQSLFYETFGEPFTNSKGWQIMSFGDLTSSINYGTSLPATDGGKYPYIRMNNLTDNGYLDLSNLKYIDIPDSELDKCLVKQGDILFNRTNSREKVGKTALFDRTEEMVIAGYIIRVRAKEDLLNPVFAVRYMNLPEMKEHLRKICRGAVNQANINSKEMASISFLVPPIKLQNQFAEKIEAIEEQKRLIESSIADLETLLASRMDYWFND